MPERLWRAFGTALFRARSVHRHAVYPAVNKNTDDKYHVRLPLLAYAVLSHNARLVDTLLSAGADPHSRIIDIRQHGDKMLPAAAKKLGKKQEDLFLSMRSHYDDGELEACELTAMRTKAPPTAAPLTVRAQ